MIEIKLLKYPKEEDWRFCKECALNTMGKKIVNNPNIEWKEAMLRAEHSPIRTLWFAFKLEIPYWVSVHLSRHKIGCEHFVQSQRDDRANNDIPRSEKPQGEIVSHILYINAQELIFMARRRLCNQASKETREAVYKMCYEVINVCPEFKDFLVPNCKYLGRCPEMYPCGKVDVNE